MGERMTNMYTTTHSGSRSINLDVLYCPEVDIPLLRKGLEWAESSHQWDQGVWINAEYQESIKVDDLDVFSCGSSYCLYGNFALGAGDYFLVPENIEDSVEWLLVDRGDDGWVIECIRERIDELLGVSELAGDELSHPDNTIKDLRVICEAIAGEKL